MKFVLLLFTAFFLFVIFYGDFFKYFFYGSVKKLLTQPFLALTLRPLRVQNFIILAPIDTNSVPPSFQANPVTLALSTFDVPNKKITNFSKIKYKWIKHKKMKKP